MPDIDPHYERFAALLADMSEDDLDDLYALALSKSERRKKLRPAQ